MRTRVCVCIGGHKLLINKLNCFVSSSLTRENSLELMILLTSKLSDDLQKIDYSVDCFSKWKYEKTKIGFWQKQN